MKTVELADYLRLSPKRRPNARITFIKGKVYLVAPHGEWIKQLVASRSVIELWRLEYEEIWGHRNQYL